MLAAGQASMLAAEQAAINTEAMGRQAAREGVATRAARIVLAAGMVKMVTRRATTEVVLNTTINQEAQAHFAVVALEVAVAVDIKVVGRAQEAQVPMELVSTVKAEGVAGEAAAGAVVVHTRAGSVSLVHEGLWAQEAAAAGSDTAPSRERSSREG